jgi:hypothetical protein
MFITKADIRVERAPITELHSNTFGKATITTSKTMLKAVLSTSTNQYNS